MADDLKEYVVTLKKKEYLDDFYEDMESPGGGLYYPDRRVDIADRRPISRNTNYYLTTEEAEILKNDPRVEAVELDIKETDVRIVPLVDQTSNFWDKTPTAQSNHKNWGLLRCFEGSNRENWITSVSGTISLGSTGKNVDIIVVDGHIPSSNSSLSSHLEFRTNPDGTGAERFVYYNWFQLNPLVSGTNTGTYYYGDNDTEGSSTLTQDKANNDHGVHVGGTVAGNTQGWARSANVYNISPYSSTRNKSAIGREFDYIRAFHQIKAVNTATGRKNPTISNHSYGQILVYYGNDISRIVYRGSVVYDRSSMGALKYNTAEQYGLSTNMASGNFFEVYVNFRSTSTDADVEDMIGDGIIAVGAAGNYSTIIDVPGGIDYDNYIVLTSGAIRYYCRGMSPTASPSMICVGAQGVDDYPAYFSNHGPRIDVWAPGEYIMSSVRNSTSSVPDPRNSSYKLEKFSGTSMASPQVAGILATALEIYPDMDQSDAKKYLYKTMVQIAHPTTWYYHYLKYAVGRGTGKLWPPRSVFSERPTRGQVWPRL